MVQTAITASQFRNDFPEFNDLDLYPTSQINFWAGVAQQFFNPWRWGSSVNIGMELFIAHNVALEAQAQLQADAGSIPGIARGVVSSESAGSVSAGYDVAASSVPDAGHWNLTTFGTRLMWMVNMFGAGPIQVGAGGYYGPFGPLNGSNIGDTNYIYCGPGYGYYTNSGLYS